MGERRRKAHVQFCRKGAIANQEEQPPFVHCPIQTGDMSTQHVTCPPLHMHFWLTWSLSSLFQTTNSVSSFSFTNEGSFLLHFISIRDLFYPFFFHFLHNHQTPFAQLQLFLLSNVDYFSLRLCDQALEPNATSDYEVIFSLAYTDIPQSNIA